MPRPGESITVFYSYAARPADERLRKRLEEHLSGLRHKKIIAEWYDRQIMPGTDWAHEIDAHLTNAAVILLLISSDFLASKYCYGIEMQRALERHKAGEARVIPVLMRPVDWKGAPFAHLQVLPTGGKPITLWDNRDAAFADVAAGIRRAIEDLEQLSPSTAAQTGVQIWNIPYPRNLFFLGREDLLAQLARLLQAGQPMALSQPQAINGLGGVGKTQVALEYAYRYAQDYQAIVWIRADSRDALMAGFVELAHALKLPERDERDQTVIMQAVKRWLSQHPGWLLILDNADSPALLPEFLPSPVRGHILLTTRAHALGRLASSIEVDTLDPAMGTLLLLRRAGLLALDAPLSQAAEADQRLALQLCQELGGLPLALDQAGAYLEETQCGLQHYLNLYRSHRADLLRHRGGFVQDHPESVATTWSLSFVAIEQRDPVAADVLRLCALLHPEAIPEEIFLQGAAHLGPTLATIEKNPLALNSALAVIQSYSLLRRNSREQTLSMHGLVQVVLHDTMTKEERNQWTQRAIAALNAIFPDVRHEVWRQCERLLPQVLTSAAVVAPEKRSAELAFLLAKTADYLRERARYQQAEPLFQHALHILEQARGPTHPDVAPFLNNLAILYYEQGKNEQAESLYQRALHILEQARGPTHPDVASSLNNLANLYVAQGQYEQAESLYQRARHLCEQALGPEHPNVAHFLNNLANLYDEQHQHEQAEPLYQRALHLWEQAFDPEHPLVAYPLNNLAELYAEQGQYERAEPLFQRALHIREQALGSEHPLVASPLNGLANLYREQGKYDQAEPLFQRALTIRQQQRGAQHSETAETLHDFARLHELQNQPDKALALYQQALAIREQRLGPEHPRTTDTRTRYAHLLQGCGRPEEAAALEAASTQQATTSDQQPS